MVNLRAEVPETTKGRKLNSGLAKNPSSGKTAKSTEYVAREDLDQNEPDPHDPVQYIPPVSEFAVVDSCQSNKMNIWFKGIPLLSTQR